MLDQNFWKKYFEVYDTWNLVSAYQESLDAIIEEADIKDGDLVLDAGCGTGNFEMRLRKNPDLKVKIVGQGHSQAGLDAYKKKIKNAKLVLADLEEKLPFPDNHFDVIICHNSLCAVRYGKRTEVLRELRRILKPGGKIVVSNLKHGWSPKYIFINDIKRKLRSLGFFKTIFLLFKHFSPTMQMYRCNREILREAEKGNLRFMDEEEIARKLEKVGFYNISPDNFIYAKQAIMNSAEK